MVSSSSDSTSPSTATPHDRVLALIASAQGRFKARRAEGKAGDLEEAEAKRLREAEIREREGEVVALREEEWFGGGGFENQCN